MWNNRLLYVLWVIHSPDLQNITAPCCNQWSSVTYQILIHLLLQEFIYLFIFDLWKQLFSFFFFLFGKWFYFLCHPIMIPIPVPWWRLCRFSFPTKPCSSWNHHVFNPWAEGVKWDAAGSNEKKKLLYVTEQLGRENWNCKQPNPVRDRLSHPTCGTGAMSSFLCQPGGGSQRVPGSWCERRSAAGGGVRKASSSWRRRMTGSSPR